ncbi:uncharacterized protein EAF01_004312 [Botrytis porri]|uniref:uncharacterized protein n=1 Tax=Botrytis porri TaxID=87229 RepID=UPI0019024DB7|nr:uncharacterized protein EAF01_004312 [Botrytis porri]KAF7908557.1 hypothetical protein EAF01_004312 [Botrytis porri]
MSTQQQLQATPPESFTSSPPTPPQTEEKTLTSILQILAESGSPSAIFAGNMENSTSADVVSKDAEYGSYQPDASFQHFDAQYPGVILELSYSQKKKDLSRLADAYILGSDAYICVRPHVGVDAIGEKELSIMQTVTDQLFRDEEGRLVLNSQASIQLQLQDFATGAFAEKLTDLTQSIHILAETFFSFFQRAETKARRMKLGEGLVRSSTPWVKKRRRDSTPPEQLDSDRESRFNKQEQKTAKKAMMDNISYKTSSSEAELE